MDEHETLPTDSILINMLAGGVAGVFENCLFYPLDTAKTRMQDLREVHLKVPKTVINTFYEMIKEEGLLSPYKGFAVTVLGSGPAHAVYFASYELSKTFLTNYRESNLNYGVAGGVATLAHDGIMTPTEAIKQRMQMENSPYKTFTECIKKVYHAEGLTAFYRSYGTQVIMNIPFQSVQFTSYELTSNFLNPSRSYNPFFHIIAGGVAGAIAAAITTPLDVCKTFLNTQESQVKVTGIRNAVLMVYKLAGPFGYFRGVSARVLFVMPSTAICWATYESMKFGLKSLTSE